MSGPRLDEADLYAALTELFRDVFKRSIALHPELTAADVPGWDSFKQVELIVALEQRYGIHFHIREINGLRDVGDLIRVLSSKTPA